MRTCTDHNYTYTLDSDDLRVISTMKDLGIIIDRELKFQLKFHDHTTTKVTKVNRLLTSYYPQVLYEH